MSERVVRDATYLIMWRVKWPGGSLSDMVNLSRANDAAFASMRPWSANNGGGRGP